VLPRLHSGLSALVILASMALAVKPPLTVALAILVPMAEPVRTAPPASHVLVVLVTLVSSARHSSIHVLLTLVNMEQLA